MKVFPDGIVIEDLDYACLLNDLVDVEDWIRGAVDGKIAACKGRLLSEWQAKLLADETVETIPAREPELIGFITGRDDYKNRVQREVSEALSD